MPRVKKDPILRIGSRITINQPTMIYRSIFKEGVTSITGVVAGFYYGREEATSKDFDCVDVKIDEEYLAERIVLLNDLNWPFPKIHIATKFSNLR